MKAVFVKIFKAFFSLFQSSGGVEDKPPKWL